jgi:hypothetical protein
MKLFWSQFSLFSRNVVHRFYIPITRLPRFWCVLTFRSVHERFMSQGRWPKGIKLFVTYSFNILRGVCFVEERNALKPYAVVLEMWNKHKTHDTFLCHLELFISLHYFRAHKNSDTKLFAVRISHQGSPPLISLNIFLWLFSPSGPRPLLWGSSITDTRHSVQLLWTSDRLVAETIHHTHKRQPCPRQDSNSQSQQASGLDSRLRPRGHWDQHLKNVNSEKYLKRIS